MPGLMDNKHKNIAKELRWQFFFSAKELTRIPKAKSYRKYHRHETHVQKAIKVAVRKAQISRRATPHTFTPLDNLIDWYLNPDGLKYLLYKLYTIKLSLLSHGVKA